MFVAKMEYENFQGQNFIFFEIKVSLTKSTVQVLKYKSSYCLQPTTICPERYRISPNVYKESGEKRLYILNDRNRCQAYIELLVIVPCPIWTILVLKLHVLNGDITLIKEVHLSNACFDVMGQVFTADQKNSTLAFALYAPSKCKKRYKSMISVVDIHPTGIGKP